MMSAMRRAVSRSFVVVVGLMIAVLGCGRSAAAKSLTAERFESVVRVGPDGTLDVTETIVFRFDDGASREVTRDIPLRRTDGVEVVGASIDGRSVPFGSGIGAAELRKRSNGIRVIWRFAAEGAKKREFLLTYRVRGAVGQTESADLLVWRGTPSEHQYRIESATIRFELPVSPVRKPEVDSRRTGTVYVGIDRTSVAVESSGMRSNGWIEASFAFPRRSLVAAAPEWQQRETLIARRAKIWTIFAAVLTLAGLIVLVAWRQGYERPPGELEPPRRTWVQPAPPDELAPALGGVLAANGRASLEHAMATLVALAERGEIDIREKLRGSFGQRTFAVSRRGRSTLLRHYEQAALDTIFAEHGHAVDSVSLSHARSRLMWRFRAFASAMTTELLEAGLLDPSRKAIRDRYTHSGVWLLVAAGLVLIPAISISRHHGGWPLLISAALAVNAVAAFILAATTTPLSNDGLRRAVRWRDYRKHLTAVAQGKGPSAGLPLPGALAFAVALGLAETWARFLKRAGHSIPAWFHPLPADDDRSAFPAFIATSGGGNYSGGTPSSGVR
jgi:hypothetical protein